MKFKILLFLWCLALVKTSIAQSVTPCLISSGVVSSGYCASVGDPVVNNCFADIQKQIARSVNAEGIVDWIFPEQCWGYPGGPPSGNTPVNCTAPYDQCNGHYCPDKYCSMIKTFVDLKASMILRAANIWGMYGYLIPGSIYHNAMKQFVIDVNAAYDCAGLRRPVLQASIFEDINIGVNGVPIPPNIIAAFIGTPGFDNNYYLTPQGAPKSNLHFNFNNIYSPSTAYPNLNSPKIVKIEAKMWFYYLAKMYIDLGYKSIHMGQMQVWAEGDAGLSQSSLILNKIRQYAQSKNTFVLLTEENYKAKKFPGSNVFMFDYDSRVLWPKEVSSPQVGSSVNNNCGVSYSYNYSNTPCASQSYMAGVDPCVITNQGNFSGISPLNNCITQYQPYNTYFDFGVGDHGNPYTATASPEQSVWGFDDTKWFANVITSASCRAYWMQQAIYLNKGFYNRFGYMSAPGLLYVPMPSNPNQIGRRYLLSDEPAVQSAIKNSWTPSNSATIGASKQCKNLKGICSIIPPKALTQNAYTFRVFNGDLTSVYTWHMQYPDGSWLPFSWGAERTFYPPYSGWYTVYLRQDNLGTYTNTPFVTVKTVSAKIYLYKQCCGNSVSARGGDAPPYPEDYEGEVDPFLEENTDFSEYDRYIETNQPYYIPEDSLSYENSLEFETIGRKVMNLKNNVFDFKIYPNPAKNTINISALFDIQHPVIVRVTDIVGRELTVAENVMLKKGAFELNISALLPGTYILTVSNKDMMINKRYKFVKQ